MTRKTDFSIDGKQSLEAMRLQRRKTRTPLEQEK